MSDNGLVIGIALGLSIAALGIGLVVILHLLNKPATQTLQTTQQPQHEEVLIKLTEAGKLSEVTPLSMQKKKIIGYVTSEG